MAHELRPFHALVVGDVMLDRWVTGNADRISPEAPVPVVKVTGSRETPGGAANLANNLRQFGGCVRLVGAVGKDPEASRLESLLAGLGIDASFVRRDGPTTLKVRVIGGHQQVARLDFERVEELDAPMASEVVQTVADGAGRADVLVISDYAKGVCTDAVCRAVIEAARDRRRPCVVQPKGRSWQRYSGASVLIPNLAELSAALDRTVENEDAAVEAGAREARDRFGFEHVLVTRSHRGATLVGGGPAAHFPAEARAIFDVTGAGDTVAAAFAAGLASALGPCESARLANEAAGRAVARPGTATVSLSELRPSAPAAGARRLPLSELLEELARLRAAGRSIVFTNGCFDLLHHGHVSLLERARSLGDVLVVGVNDDASVRRLKGNGRPINSEQDRVAVLQALACVDFVTVFDEDTPARLIRAVAPDVLVKGGDYREKEVVGREVALRTVVLPLVQGTSTTRLLSRVRNGV